MSRAHPHGFPGDTPEPVAQPYSAIDELLQLVLLWIKVAAVGAALLGLLAFFYPDLLLILFR
jgi:hypothetical protein